MAVKKESGAGSPAKTSSTSSRGGRGKKKPAPKGTPRSWAALFWLAFAIFIFGLFLFNREAIGAGIETIKSEISARKTPPARDPLPLPEDAPPSVAVRSPAPEAFPSPAAAEEKPAPVITEERRVPPPEPARTAAPVRETPKPAPENPAPAEKPAPPNEAPAPPPAAPSPAGIPSAPKPAEQRERTLYFTQVDRGGSILRIKVNRKLPLSDSPMTDVIQALVEGPDAEEKRKGLISLIPENTRILSAVVRGNTAYISFSEDFQYNTYGVEGYAGQLREVVYTVTEFPNVRDVQILIEGRRVDYLGEGIWIGSPINRDIL